MYLLQNFSPILFFGVGVFAAALQRIKTKEGHKNFFACTMACLLLTILTTVDISNLSAFNFKLFSYFFLALVVFTSTTFLAKEILLQVSEITIFIYTILFWYIYLTRLPTREMLFSGNTSPVAFFVLFVLFTVLVLQRSFSKAANKTWMEVLMYIWFLIVNLFVFFLVFAEEILVQIPPVSSDNNYWSLLFFKTIQGMAFFSVVSNLSILWNLIPLPNKSQSFEEKIKQIADYIEVINLKFSEGQVRPLFVFLLIFMESFIFIFNYHYKLFSDKDLIYVVLITGSVFTSLKLFYSKEQLNRQKTISTRF